jgi:hypothetical protein
MTLEVIPFTSILVGSEGNDFHLFGRLPMDTVTRAVVDGAVGMTCVAALTYMLRHLIGATLPAMQARALEALETSRQDYTRYLAEQRVADAERMGRVEARWERAAQAAYAHHTHVAEQLARVERALAGLAERLDRENGQGDGE